MVLFDLDGVLVDSRAAFLNSMTLALTDLELPSFTREQLLPCIGPPLKVGFSGLLATAPEDPRVDALITAYRGHYATISLTDTTVSPGMREALAALDQTKAQTITQALERLGTTDAVMIGDRRFDVEGAHANGIPCIGVTWGIGSREELEAAGADTIIDDPLELDPALRVMSRP